MQKCLAFIGVLTALTAGAFAQDEETPATPKYRHTPPYPAACLPEEGTPAASHKVTLMFDIDRDGRVENVRVRESSDPCFEDVATATARAWKYEPRLVNGSPKPQQDVEVTVTFKLNEEDAEEDFDARPFVRVPPEYPEHCIEAATDKETVRMRFDVTATGATENVKVIETTQRCLNNAAIESVKAWKYHPKMVNGEAVRRNGLETSVSFHYNRSRHTPDAYRMRSSVYAKLKSAQRLGKKEATLPDAIARLESLHEEAGGSFSHVELAAFHQVRSVVRLESGDYPGALDDLRLLKRLGVIGDASEGVDETIAKLESALGVAPDAPPPQIGDDDVE